MKKISELDRAQLKNEFKNLVKSQGIEVGYQVLYEFLASADCLGEVLIELIDNEKKI